MSERDEVTELAYVLGVELSDTECGALSDTSFVRSELVDGGTTLDLFDTGDETAWPVASFDVGQLASALIQLGYRKGGAA